MATPGHQSICECGVSSIIAVSICDGAVSWIIYLRFGVVIVPLIGRLVIFRFCFSFYWFVFMSIITSCFSSWWLVIVDNSTPSLKYMYSFVKMFSYVRYVVYPCTNLVSYTFNILCGVMKPVYVAVLIDILGHMSFFCFQRHIDRRNKCNFSPRYRFVVWIKPLVQNVSITDLIVNLLEQNVPLSEICIESVSLSKFRLRRVVAMSFLFIDCDFSLRFRSCTTHMSPVQLCFPLTKFCQDW